MREIFKSQAMKKFLHNKKAMLGLAIVVLLVLAVLFIPLFKDMDPYTTDRLAGFNSKPSAAHPLGTDDVGRDLFARLLYGGRISLFVGIMSTIISVAIGIPLGLIAGYFRGPAESIIMRTADAFMSFPSMVLILVLVAVFGPSILTVTVVIGILGWTAIAKLIYGNVLSIREREYSGDKSRRHENHPDPVYRSAAERDPAGMGQHLLPCGRRDPYGVVLKLLRHGRSDAAGLLGQHHLRSTEPDGTDGPSLGLDPAGTLYHPCSCRFQFYR